MEKHALITGSSVRVGRVIALCLAEAGWDLTLHHKDSKVEVEALASDIKKLGRKVVIIEADYEDASQVDSMLSVLSGNPVTAIIHSASLFLRDEDDPDGLRHNVVNYEVPLKLSKSIARLLPTGQMGAIVHFLDNTEMPDFLQGYSKSRTKLKESLFSLAQAYAPTICVNAVALGPTLKNERESEAHFQELVDQTILKRPSDPLDVARAVLFLLSAFSTTGQILNIDSGMHIVN